LSIDARIFNAFGNKSGFRWPQTLILFWGNRIGKTSPRGGKLGFGRDPDYY